MCGNLPLIACLKYTNDNTEEYTFTRLYPQVNWKNWSALLQKNAYKTTSFVENEDFRAN